MKRLAAALSLALVANCPAMANQYAIPVNSIVCSDFEKTGSQTWRALRDVTVQLSASPGLAVRAGPIDAGAYVSSDGHDLLRTIQMKCS